MSALSFAKAKASPGDDIRVVVVPEPRDDFERRPIGDQAAYASVRISDHATELRRVEASGDFASYGRVLVL